MKKGQEYIGKVNEYEFPNKGIILYNDEGCMKKIVVKGTLPGQTVRFALSKKRFGKYEGRLEEILEPSVYENREPDCEHCNECGGCTYQTVSYENQLILKSDMVKSIMDKAVKGDYIFEGILGSPNQWGYRNKMEFSFGDEYKDGPLSLGLHKKGSFYDILTTSACRIVNEDYNAILTCVLEYCSESELTFYHKMKHTGYLRHLVIRRAVKTGEILVNLVTSGNFDFKVYPKENSETTECTESEKSVYEIFENMNCEMKVDREKEFFEELKKRILNLKLHGTVAGILHTVNDSLADTVQSDGTDIIYGKEYITEKLLGLEFKISTFSFFQTNTLGAEVLYSKAREYVGDTKDKVVFDLYSGTGTIAQIIAPVASKVIGVEIVEEAVEAAKENAKLNGLDNCDFIAGDVLKVIDEIQDKPDFIILDPPRDGIHPKALDKIIDYGVDKMVYISCKPTSLARDLEKLQERGYRVEKVCAVDMFPQTVHVETVVLLSKLKSTKTIEVDLELSELDLTKAESKATYAEIKQYVLEKFDLKVSQLYIAQVKREFGLIERINYNVGEGKNHVPQVTPEKRDAIIDALKYYQMI